MMAKKRKKYKPEELQDPKNRAQFIRQMGIGMREEVLWQYRNMAAGGLGGTTYEKPGETVRFKHYKGTPNSWFGDVLYEYRLLERENGS